MHKAVLCCSTFTAQTEESLLLGDYYKTETEKMYLSNKTDIQGSCLNYTFIMIYEYTLHLHYTLNTSIEIYIYNTVSSVRLTLTVTNCRTVTALV